MSAQQLIEEQRKLEEQKNILEAWKRKLEVTNIELQQQRQQINSEGQKLNLAKQLFEDQRTKMASTIGTINEFARNENWTLWHERLEQYFLANSVNEDRKAALFLTLIGSEGYSILRSLCSPELPSTKTYVQLVTLMKGHMEPEPNVILERFNFKQCKQRDGEDIKKFVENLKKVSIHCKFGSSQMESMRDQFVWGLATEMLQKRLLREKELTFDKAVELAITFEIANKGTVGWRDDSQVDTERVNYVNNNNNNKRSTNSNGRSSTKKNVSNLKCFCCGKSNHYSSDCRYKFLSCNICQKRGHLQSVCKLKDDFNKKINNKEHFKKGDNDEVRLKSKQNYLEECDLSGDFDNLYSIKDTVNERVNFVKPYEIILNVEKKDIKFEIDTGSPVTAFSKEFFVNVGFECKLEKTNRKFQSYSGEPIIPIGKIYVNVEFDNECKTLELFIFPGEGLPIIGRDWMAVFKIFENLENKKINKIDDLGSSKMQKILQEFDIVFSKEIGFFNKGKFKLELKENFKPVFCKPRPVPYALKDKIEKELERLVSQNVIYSVKSCEWATPVVPVLKKSGKIRLCGDYKITLNPNSKIDRYPVPRIQDLFVSLKPSIVFSKLDLSSEYQQLELDEESQLLTTISTHRGLFAFKRLTFGIASAPGIFQREMEKLFFDMQGVLVFFDDILITGSSQSEHDERLKNFLCKLKESGLKLEKSKCELSKDRIVFLGYELSSEGIKVSDNKVEAIKEIPRPMKVKELQVFLGSVNYHAKFIRGFSEILSPLYKLLKKGVKWEWSQVARNVT